MIQPLITGERGCAALVAFAETVTWLQECTDNADLIQRAFQRLRPGEHSTAKMLDAVSQAIDRLRKRPNARRVLLLISESRDRSSESKLEDVSVAAQSADVTIYAATYSTLKTGFTSQSPISEKPRSKDPQATPESEVMKTRNGAPPSKYNPEVLPEAQQVDLRAGIGELLRLHQTNTTQVLAAVTGGITFPFTRQKGLEDALVKLGAELHSQYFLSFVPEDSAPGYHKLQVSLVREGRFSIRARPGYWSAGPR